MSDVNYETFQHYGTNAQRLAFTPAPAAGIQPIYIWYETDTDLTYIYTTGWKGPIPGGGGITANIKRSITDIGNTAILTLPTTPVSLSGIVAPGSGFGNKLISARIITKFAAGAYTNINASYAAFAIYNLGDFSQWASCGIVDDSTATLTRFTNTFGMAANKVNDPPPYVDNFSNGWIIPNAQLYASVNNTALAVAIDNNGSGNLTGGNIANIMRIIAYYTTEALP